MNHQNTIKELDWRTHMHSLPNPDLPTSGWLRWFILSAKFVFTFAVGILVVFVGGVIFGLLFDLGPEHADAGTTCVFIGMILNFSFGFLIFYFNRWRGISIFKSRLYFYTFTMSSWFICFTQVANSSSHLNRIPFNW